MSSIHCSRWMAATFAAATRTGQVATQAEKQLALRIAKDTDGVRNVADQIQVAKR